MFWKKQKESPVSQDAWLEGFSAGFSKAWDMMMPMMKEGFNRSIKAIHDQAVTDTLAGLGLDRKKNAN